MAEYQIIGVTSAIYGAWEDQTIIVVDADNEVDAAQQVLFKGYVMGAPQMSPHQMAAMQWSQRFRAAWHSFTPAQQRQMAEHFEPYFKSRRA